MTNFIYSIQVMFCAEVFLVLSFKDSHVQLNQHIVFLNSFSFGHLLGETLVYLF